MNEYVIRLSTMIDNDGVQQILKYMDMTKLKALGLTAALSGIGTAIYKFAANSAKWEFELQKLAKEQGKTTAAVNASEKALKAMGKTAADIEKDESLKKVYEDIKNFNQEMQLPGINNALENITKLRNAFWKMKSALNMATQSIARHFLNNMEAPIKRITGGLDDISDWFRLNLQGLSTKVSLALTDFSKGIITIGSGINNIFQSVRKLPDDIKRIGLAVGGAWALAKGGTLARILALVGLTGDITHDYDNYQWNKENQKTGKYTNADGSPYQIPIGLGDIWQIWDGPDGVRDKTKKTATRLFEMINKGLEDTMNFLNKSGGSGLTEWITKYITGDLGEALGGIVEWVKTKEGRGELATFAHDLLFSIASVLSKGGEIGTEITSGVAQLLFQAFTTGTDWETAWKESNIKQFLSTDNAFSVGLHSALEVALAGGNLMTSVISGAIAGYQNSRKQALRKLYDDKIAEGWKPTGEAVGPNDEGFYTWLEGQFGSDPGLEKYVGQDLADDLSTTFNTILEIASKGIKIADSTAGLVVKQIIQGIADALKRNPNDGTKMGTVLDKALSDLGEDNAVFNAISLGLGTWIGTGNFGTGIVVGIADAINSYANDPQKMGEDFKKVGDALDTLWNGVWVASEHGNSKIREGGLKKLFEGMWGGEDGLKAKFDDIASKITAWLDPIKEAVVNWFNGLILDITEQNPVLKWLFGDQNTSQVYSDEDGNVSVLSSNGQKKTFYAGENGESGISKDAKEVLERLSGYYRLDENGNVVMTHGGDKYYTEVQSQSFAGWFGGKDKVGLKEVLQYIMDNGVLPGEGDRGNAKIQGIYDFNLDNADALLEAFGIETVNTGEPAGVGASEGPNIGASAGRGTPKPRATLASMGKADVGSGGSGEKDGLAKLGDEADAAAGEIHGAAESSKGMEQAFNKFGSYLEQGAAKAETFGDRVKGSYLKMEDDLSGVAPAADTAGGALTGLASAASSAAGALSSISAAGGGGDGGGAGTGGTGKAWGGRIGRRMDGVTIGEDGTEYVIPITKPERAAQLIQQMFGEMGSSALQKVMAGLGLGESGTNGASLDSLKTALGGSGMTNNISVNAPVNINVNANGADAKEIGTYAYDLAERHLIKNVMGVYA